MHCMISLQIYTLLLYTILHCISSVHLYLTITPTHWELSRRRKVDPEEERLMVMVMDILTSDFTRKCCRSCWCCDIVGRPWWCDGDGVCLTELLLPASSVSVSTCTYCDHSGVTPLSPSPGPARWPGWLSKTYQSIFALLLWYAVLCAPDK